jgi:hypothetical protein
VDMKSLYIIIYLVGNCRYVNDIDKTS